MDAQPGKMTPAEAHRMFRRVLSGWALDTMRLRRAGLDIPTARHLLFPTSGTCAGDTGEIGAQFRTDQAQERAA